MSKTGFLRFCTLLISLLFSASTFAGKDAVADEDNPIFTGLSQLSAEPGDHDNKCDGTITYYPSGGIRSIYCHLKHVVSVESIKEAYEGQIFVSGQDPDDIKLNSATSFGHYNPGFVKWFTKKVIPGSDDTAKIKLTRKIYDAFFRNAARVYFVVYKSLDRQKEFKINQIEKYKEKIDSAEDITTGRYFSCPNVLSKWPDNYDQSYPNTNWLASGATFFWLRRAMGGTEKEFYAALEKLLSSYDKEFVESVRSYEGRMYRGDSCFKRHYH